MIYSITDLKGVITIMKNWGKKLLGLAAVSSAAAGLIYYLKKKDINEDDEFADDFEDEDFDLDSDLKPVTDHEYVSLNQSDKSVKEETVETVPEDEAPAEEKAEGTDTEESTEEA